jgi:hypothetical protein
MFGVSKKYAVVMLSLTFVCPVISPCTACAFSAACCPTAAIGVDFRASGKKKHVNQLGRAFKHYYSILLETLSVSWDAFDFRAAAPAWI